LDTRPVVCTRFFPQLSGELRVNMQPKGSAKASGRKSRNDSPGPKAKAAIKSPSAEELKQAQDAVAKAEAAKKEAEKNICGFHPQAFWVLVLGPLAVLSVIVATVFLDVGKRVAIFVEMQWSSISGPLAKALQNNNDGIVDSLLVVSALIGVAPLLFLALVTLWNALQDLGNFALWQQALLGTIVTVAVGTSVAIPGTRFHWDVAVAMDAIRTQWNKVSDPIEAILAKEGNADNFIAGCAICCLAPIAAALAAYVVRFIYGLGRLETSTGEAKSSTAS